MVTLRREPRLPKQPSRAGLKKKRSKGAGTLCGNLHSPNCPTRSVLDHVGSRWGALILLSLAKGALRYSDLSQKIGGISEKMLVQTLRSLEHDGFVSREVIPSRPPRVSYSLTTLGSELASHLQTLAIWIERNVAKVVEHRTRADAGEIF